MTNKNVVPNAIINKIQRSRTCKKNGKIRLDKHEKRDHDRDVTAKKTTDLDCNVSVDWVVSREF